MKLTLLRHGQTDWNVQRRMQGRKDVPLNSTGIKQILEIGEFFSTQLNYRFDRMIASPLLRTQQTAALCSEILRLPAELRDEFQERSFGDLEGQTIDEIRQCYQIEDVEEMAEGCYGVESLDSFRERLQQGLRYLEAAYPSDRILLITHGSVIKAIAGFYGIETCILKNGTYIELK
ncbi:histidine phosphatase family protein [Ammoniphilus sp. 3BR4]|uniref:histidine phosphatase family protein n=1 Tax=Ammoniphilus sp. 3BR4 TaxID=3158265 RepID=UPI003465D5A4